MPSPILCAFLFFALTCDFALTNANNMIASTSSRTRLRFSTKLIHRDSIYHPNATVSERANRALNSSIARLVGVSARISRNHDQVEADLLPSGDYRGLFYIRFGIGRPPITQLALMDTGSHILWVKCLPCTNCSHNSEAIFNPTKSSTYADIHCGRNTCTYPYCEATDECPYNVSYVSGPGAHGVLSYEQLTFETAGNEEVEIPDVIFLCGREMAKDHGEYDGVFGLSVYDFPSLMPQFSSNFSYCIGNIMDPSYSYNQLFLYESAIMQGDSTPFQSIHGRYYVTLEGISLGDDMLNIDPDIFEVVPSTGKGVIIDSGTPYTWLVQEAFDALKDEVEYLLNQELERDKRALNQLCYIGNMDRDLTGFPVVTLHFAGGAELVLDTNSMFMNYGPDLFCMAVASTNVLRSSAARELSVIGMMAQQNYYVGYDLYHKRVYFQRIDCELLAY